MFSKVFKSVFLDQYSAYFNFSNSNLEVAILQPEKPINTLLEKNNSVFVVQETRLGSKTHEFVYHMRKNRKGEWKVTNFISNRYVWVTNIKLF